MECHYNCKQFFNLNTALRQLVQHRNQKIRTLYVFTTTLHMHSKHHCVHYKYKMQCWCFFCRKYILCYTCLRVKLIQCVNRSSYRQWIQVNYLIIALYGSKADDIHSSIFKSSKAYFRLDILSDACHCVVYIYIIFINTISFQNFEALFMLLAFRHKTDIVEFNLILIFQDKAFTTLIDSNVNHKCH